MTNKKITLIEKFFLSFKTELLGNLSKSFGILCTYHISIYIGKDWATLGVPAMGDN